MSDQKHSYDRSHSCPERSQRVFLSNFFHHALEIYFPHILSDFMLKKTIIEYVNFLLMSAHKK